MKKNEGHLKFRVPIGDVFDLFWPAQRSVITSEVVRKLIAQEMTKESFKIPKHYKPYCSLIGAAPNSYTHAQLVTLYEKELVGSHRG